MLKTRVITALVITSIGLAAVFLMPPPAFAAFAIVILLALGGWEGAQLGGLDRPLPRCLYAATLVVVGSLIYWLHDPGKIVPWLVPGALAWIGFLCWLTRPGAGASARSSRHTLKLIILGVILLTAWLAIIWLQSTSPWLVLMLLVVIASADVGAYFTGRAVGGPKLAPSISPGKTRSGAAGGLLAAMLATAVVASFLPDSPFSPLQAGLLALLLAAISIGGDLFISLLKRQRQLKDTSQLLPGHGGILDRFDSIGAAAPMFALAVALLGQ
ncbi:MAG: phosphatidate cytidylyltransferase [Wenzhouxiangella sp.]|nr:phosphatidate cytidylyltransferase [Wenzhouxiangella sp.]MCH8477557.1 phosphatidate cytidylyltransferase [Wenzhouxiangella sp.]